jgi:heat shock protein HslJ
MAFVALFTVACNTSKKASTDADTDSALVEKCWKLIELNGVSVANKNSPKEPHIIFKIDGNRFNGNAGCNSIMGSYQIKHPGRISFSEVASTMMMCLNMETEELFKQTLEKADSYIVKNDSLTLNRARMAPLARFVAVYMK